jgi:hypothetical protein
MITAASPPGFSIADIEGADFPLVSIGNNTVSFSLANGNRPREHRAWLMLR